MGGTATRLGAVNRIPRLWALAYAPHHPAPLRLAARAALRVAGFFRLLAQADHQTFLTH